MSLTQKWQLVKEKQPGIRIRDAAQYLGCSEADLVATRLGSDIMLGGTERLRGPWPDVIASVGALGPVRALTRNDLVVHERDGVYGPLSVEGHVGLIVGDDIDLRIFFHHWKYGFAVAEAFRDEYRFSLQFFDAAGMAVHKIYATERTDLRAFEAMVARFRNSDQHWEPITPSPMTKTGPRPDSECDTVALRKAWSELRDTHDFFPMLRRLGLDRQQSFRLVGPDYAQPLSNDSTRRMLLAAAQNRLPIMVFVGNPGMIQIHTGPVEKLLETGPWFNVLDPIFNLHLREDAIATSWLVRKPTADGVVTSLEVFDRRNDLAVSFFGKRKPGIPEMTDWRRLAESLTMPEAA